MSCHVARCYRKIPLHFFFRLERATYWIEQIEGRGLTGEEIRSPECGGGGSGSPGSGVGVGSGERRVWDGVDGTGANPRHKAGLPTSTYSNQEKLPGLG